MVSRKYLLISPCRDEAEYLQKTIDSVVSQTILPTKWVIVDDGSTDATPEMLAKAAKKYPFIEIVTRKDRGKRAVGSGVIEAFYTGYQTINPHDYDYICKLDLDLEIPARYFETMMERMESNPRLGTCSGKPYFFNSQGKLISEKCGNEMSVGMIKFYRVNCFEQIGGFIREVMWDGIDCHTCRMLGWIACSWDEPEIRFIHLRPMGSSDKSIFKGRMRHGFGQYFMGTGLIYMIVSCIYRMTTPPIFTGGLFMLIGYLQSWFQGKPRYKNAEFRYFLSKYQWKCLIKGKNKATELYNQSQAVFWQPDRLSTKVIPVQIN